MIEFTVESKSIDEQMNLRNTSSYFESGYVVIVHVELSVSVR